MNLLLALAYVPCMMVTLWAPEPERPPEPVRTLKEAVWGPFLGFLAQHRALEILCFVLLYKLSDQLTQALMRPFFIKVGFDDFHVGLGTTTVGVVAMLAGTQVAPRVLRFGPQNVLMGGVLIQALALAAWATVIDVDAGYVTGFLLPAVLWSFGLGVSIVSSFVVCTMGLTGPIAGAGSGLATTTYQAGGAIGLAGLVAIADARTHAVADSREPLEALVSGYQFALWCSVAVALVAALLTRFIRFDAQPHTGAQPS